jgi:hypothetical protein
VYILGQSMHALKELLGSTYNKKKRNIWKAVTEHRNSCSKRTNCMCLLIWH